MGLMDFRPILQVTINGQLLSGVVFSQIKSVEVTDASGIVSDTATINFTNTSVFDRFAMPDPGAEVEISLGYFGNFHRIGLFVADEVEESSPPRQISVTCRAKINVSSSTGMGPISEQKSRSWAAGTTLAAIVEKISGENGLEPAVVEAAGAIVPGHVDQIDESDISLLTRLATKYDLIAKPVAGRLFLGVAGASISASGTTLPSIAIAEASVTQWMMRRSAGEVAGTVVATYRDLAAGKDVDVSVGDQPPVRRLPLRYANVDEATAVADAEARRQSRAVERLEFSLPGDPRIMAESRIEPLDWSEAAAGAWVVERVRHRISEDGFSTYVAAVRPS